jgi:putative transposase
MRTRLEDIELRKRAKHRGEKKIVKATTATRAEYSASRPLQVVQIDRTRADVFVVDEQRRSPIGRPWLTLALDAYSRMVPGLLPHDGCPISVVDQHVPAARRVRQIGVAEGA